MTTPSGLLAYGQAGVYNAIDDRGVISALAAGRAGVQAAPTLAAGSGLAVTVGPWRAVVDCGDGTSAVIGSLATATVTPAAGGSAARTDVLWADINVAAGTWQLALITPSQTAGRAGVELGRITVPANANTAAAMSFAPALVTFAARAALTAVKTSGDTAITSTSWVTDPDISVQVEPRSSYLVTAILLYRGGSGASAGHFRFGWVPPAGWTGAYGGTFAYSSDGALRIIYRAWNATDANALTSGLTDNRAVQVTGTLITAANGGTFALRTAKVSTSDTNSFLMQGSGMSLVKQ